MYEYWILVLSCLELFATPWTVAGQATLSMGFSSRILGWVFTFLLQGIFLTQESNRGLQYYRLILYQISYQGSPLLYDSCTKSVIRKQGKIIIIKGGRILGFPSGSDGKVSACNAGETRV